MSFSVQSTLCRQALPLQGRCTDIWRLDLPPCRRWRPETGLVPESVLHRPVTEAVSFCSPYSYLHRLVSEGSRNQDGSPRCSGKALPGRADTSPLAGKVVCRILIHLLPRMLLETLQWCFQYCVGILCRSWHSNTFKALFFITDYYIKSVHEMLNTANMTRAKYNKICL